jgi:hypothetical protein
MAIMAAGALFYVKKNNVDVKSAVEKLFKRQ